MTVKYWGGGCWGTPITQEEEVKASNSAPKVTTQQHRNSNFEMILALVGEVCVCVYVCNLLATKVFIGKSPATG